jgi:hypothetical protein
MRFRELNLLWQQSGDLSATNCIIEHLRRGSAQGTKLTRMQKRSGATLILPT